MFMKYLALISEFNGTRVTTVGLFDNHDEALSKAKKVYEKLYGIYRYYVIPMEVNKEVYIGLHDEQKKYQKYCDMCKESSEKLDSRNGKLLCGSCSFKEHLKWCESKNIK